MHNRTTDYLAVGGLIIFAVTLLMVLMAPAVGNAKPLHVRGLLGVYWHSPCLTFSQSKFEKENWIRSLSLTILASCSAHNDIKGCIALPIYNAYGVFGFFKRTGGALTIGEAAPLNRSMGHSTITLQSWFCVDNRTCNLTYEATKKKHSGENIAYSMYIHGTVGNAATEPVSYYYAVNAAILSAYLGVRFLDLAGWKDLN
jgi:dolichyl-diphosphooligosaccharide--protein glycosyltransferase